MTVKLWNIFYLNIELQKMSKVKFLQTGKDGIGKPKTVIANSITLKAKEVQVLREGTIKVTGMSTGTSYTIELLVDQGNKSLKYVPPATIKNSIPISSFTLSI